MNPIQRAFDFKGQQVRTVVKDDEPWFVAKDVCEILGLSNPSMAVSKLDGDERAKFNLGRQGEVNAVNEYGLYNLVLSSRKPEAKQFKRWITHEVIPSIRKTGQYSVEPKSQSELILMLAQQNVETEKRLQQLEEKAAAAHHRIDNYDKLDTIGDLQQRLNAMIRKYAAQSGLGYPAAWREFRKAYNTAFRTNLMLLIENYKFKHGIKKLSMPEYLAKTNRLEDAIRVADKLLNRNRVGVSG